MNTLCFDISSSGVSAALFNSELEILKFTEVPWQIADSELLTDTVLQRFKQTIHDLDITEPLDAICIGSFMHSCVLLDFRGRPLTRVYKWSDPGDEEGVEYVRNHLKGDFHQRTGCRFHPMFPVFRLASLRARDSRLLAEARKVVSVKTLLIHQLTGAWIEDFGMASASGLYDAGLGDWDPVLLEMLTLKQEAMPSVSDKGQVVGSVTTEGRSQFGLPARTPIINGSGDGFLAHIGSGCETPAQISISLGTSAAVRQSLSHPVLNTSSGTFCYKSGNDTYLLGCAGNNGGNVLDWGRSVFGHLEENMAQDPPIFIPLLNGERSPEWNPLLKGSWHGLTARHNSADLGQSILEGVVFNIGHLLDILQQTSAVPASAIVLSGNGFLQHSAAPTLAAILELPVWMPSRPGMASLRGAAVCAMRVLGQGIPALHAHRTLPLNDPRIAERYHRFKALRSANLC